MRMESDLYFAYGSNLNREGMAARCADSEPVAAAVLEGWGLTFRGVADIERREGARAHGALWRVSARDLKSLDSYEGYPSLYGRERLTVSADGEELAAFAYVMRDDYLGLPSDSYLDSIRRGYEQWELPAIALDFAVARVMDRLFDLGVRRFTPDGPKRLRPA